MNTKIILTLYFITATTFLPIIYSSGGNDLNVTLIATAIVTLVIVPFIIRYCRSAEEHVARFMTTPTSKNAFLILFPSEPKKSNS